MNSNGTAYTVGTTTPSPRQPEGRPTLARLWGSLVGDRPLDALTAALAGLVVGAVVVAGLALGLQWAFVAIIGLAALAVVLLTGNLRGLILVVLVLDIPLGLDFGLGNRLQHNGGPSGFVISLMTIALVAGYVAWIAHKNAQPRRPLSHWSVSLPVLLYVFAMLVSVLQARVAWFSFTELFLELQFVLMYFYLSSQVKAWADLRLVFTALIAALLVESAVIIVQYLFIFDIRFLGVHLVGFGTEAGDTVRLAGTLGHPNVAATFLAVGLLMTLGATLMGSRLVDRRLALPALAFGLAGLIAAQSRAAWLVLVVLAPLLILYALRRNLGTRIVWVLGLCVILVAIAFSSTIIERLTTDDGGSAQSRVWQTKLAFNILRDYPLTGIGLNNLWESMPPYIPVEMLGNENVIHNRYLTVWVETGVLGLLAFLWMFGAAIVKSLRALLRARNPYISVASAALLAALLGCMMHMLVATFNERPRLEIVWLLLGLIVAATNLAGSESLPEPPGTPRPPRSPSPESRLET